MSSTAPVFLIAAGQTHPEAQLTSAELVSRVPELSPGWSEQYLGMESRRVLEVGERADDLAIASLASALSDAGWAGETLDAVIHAGSVPDQVAPALASFIAKPFQPSAIAFDVAAGCGSFMYGLSVSV